MKKTRVKLDSENSLFVRSKIGICIYEVLYDSCVLVESEEAPQEYCVMIFYNDDNLLLQTVVNKETIEEKFRWILNKAPNRNLFRGAYIYLFIQSKSEIALAFNGR